MKARLFATRFSDDGLVLSDKTLPYSAIRAISHFNTRHLMNFVPEYETFCVLITDSNGESTVLYDRIKLRQYAGADGLLTGFRIPEAIEKKITNLRYEYLATVELLHQKSGVSPIRKGFLFETGMEFLALVKNTHAASASESLLERPPVQSALGYTLGKWVACLLDGLGRKK